MLSLFARRVGATFLLSASLIPTLAAQAAPIQPTYHLVAQWKLPGDSYWDYLTLDAPAHRLYITRDTQIQVLDTQNGHLVDQIGGLEDAHGVAIDARIGHGFATSGGQNRVVVFSLKTLKILGAIPVGNGPDAIAFEPKTAEIFAMNGEGNSVSVIDAKSRRLLKTIALGGNPESAVSDGKGHVWINIEGTSMLAEVDAKSLKLMHIYAVSPGQEPTGLAYDAKNQRLFVSCANQKLIVVSARNGKVEAVLPIGKGVDAAAFDPKLGLAFTSNGRSGTISIAGEDAAKKPAILATLATSVSARTLALDPQSHALFVVTADYLPKKPGARWPEMVPGTARVLKFTPGAK